ncbi:MAG: CopD family protein [Nitrospirota bacterium]
MTVLVVWLHLLAAVSWIGGMVFLSVVLVPTLKVGWSAAQRAILFRTVALKFRFVVWVSVGVLVATGPALLALRGLSLLEPSRWSSVLTAKLFLVLTLLALTGAHDFVVGPRVGRIQQQPEADRTEMDRLLVAWSPWIARLSLVLALGILFLAVALVRT